VRSWSILPRGTSKNRIWLGTFFGSVFTIFISFSGSVIVFIGLVNDTADSYSRGSVFGLFMALLKAAQNVNATTGQSFFLHLNNYFRFVVKTNRIFYMSHFFSYYYTHQNCLLLNCWWRLLISGVVYKSAGDNYWSAMSSTNPRCSLQIRGVIYQSVTDLRKKFTMT